MTTTGDDDPTSRPTGSHAAGDSPPANPFSREGACVDQPGGGDASVQAGSPQADPYAPPPEGAPYAPPPQGAPYAPPPQTSWPSYGAEPPAPGSPYGTPAGSAYGYDQTQHPTTPYSTTPYPANPYQDPSYPATPGYPAAGYGYGPPPSHPEATTALVFGIVGLALCPFVGIAAFVKGRRIRAEIAAEPQRWSGHGIATAAWVLGIISIVYSGLAVVYLAFLGIAAAMGAAG